MNQRGAGVVGSLTSPAPDLSIGCLTNNIAIEFQQVFRWNPVFLAKRTSTVRIL
jgi:hypothetical protein